MPKTDDTLHEGLSQPTRLGFSLKRVEHGTPAEPTIAIELDV